MMGVVLERSPRFVRVAVSQDVAVKLEEVGQRTRWRCVNGYF